MEKMSVFHFKEQWLWHHESWVQIPGYPSLLSGFGNTSYVLKFSFLVCKIVIIMSALQACEVHATTLESTEPNAKGIFLNINENICHVWKAMNYKIIAMKVPNVYHEEE